MSREKIPITPSGIEPATFLLVAQCPPLYIDEWNSMRLVPFVHQGLNVSGSLSESPLCRRFGKDGVAVAASILRITQLKELCVLLRTHKY